jgi:hypothetical protein
MAAAAARLPSTEDRALVHSLTRPVTEAGEGWIAPPEIGINDSPLYVHLN